MDFINGASIEYITPKEVAEILHEHIEASLPSQVAPVIIDVRDIDYKGGHIRTAINIQSNQFLDDTIVDELVDKYKDRPLIIFHCMMSQVRGPMCAKRFVSRMDVVLRQKTMGDDGNLLILPTVKLLRGGYEEFARLYEKDSTLIELD